MKQSAQPNKAGEVAGIEAEAVIPVIPDITVEDDEIENLNIDYSTRAPEDWVSSGPLGPNGYGRGRHFDTWEDVERWGREFYGARYKGLKGTAEEREGQARWAILVRGPRGEVN